MILTIIFIIIIAGIERFTAYYLIISFKVVFIIIQKFLSAIRTSVLRDGGQSSGKVIQITMRQVIFLIRYNPKTVFTVVSILNPMRITAIISNCCQTAVLSYV